MNWLYTLFGTPLGYVMRAIYSFIQNYGFSIIIFTVFTRLILFPISFKQQKNLAQTKALSPKLQELKRKYPNNPQKMQEEQMKLYSEEGVNPMASCLPMAIQFILLFGVLDVVYRPLTHILNVGSSVIDKAKAIVVDHQDVFSNITFSKTDLRQELKIMQAVQDKPDMFSSIDGFTDKISHFNNIFMGIDLSQTPDFTPDKWTGAAVLLFMIPIMSGIIQLILTIYTQFNQKKSNPDMPNMGCMNVMLYAMPIFSVWFAFQVPAGVGFYWIISSLVSLIQTIGLNMYMTDERMGKIAAKEKEKYVKKMERNGGKSGGFMAKIMQQQQAMQEGGTNRVNYSDAVDGMSKKERNEYNSQVIRDARKKMAEKYGDSFDDDDQK